MLDDLLRPCEGDADCGIGDIICEGCGKAYCDDHFDLHECEEEQ
jgi:hypothetical protein